MYCMPIHASRHCGRDTDVQLFKGARDPIIGSHDSSKQWEGHGTDGLGGAGQSSLGKGVRTHKHTPARTRADRRGCRIFVFDMCAYILYIHVYIRMCSSFTH